jgi:hypothetical protein
MAVTLLAWTLSVLFYPLFVPRYFTPQLIVGFALNVAFCEWLVRFVRRREAGVTRRFAVTALVAPTALLCAVLLNSDPVRRLAPCADGNGAFFEAGFVRGDLPVIADSPHVFLPRATSGLHAATYRFPLDWDVVLGYPQRSRGNAVDFHIMQNLKSWAGMSSIMSTEDIMGSYPQFLAIEISDRAWLHHLRNSRDIAAEKLAEVTNPGGSSCTLWKVTGATARR